MKTMLRLTAGLIVCFCLTSIAVTVFASESICWSKEPGSTANEITKSYEKYKSNEKLVNAYLKGVAGGFNLGVQGRSAHLPISFEISEEGANLNGYSLGYFHGLAVYCSMAGQVTKYREP